MITLSDFTTSVMLPISQLIDFSYTYFQKNVSVYCKKNFIASIPDLNLIEPNQILYYSTVISRERERETGGNGVVNKDLRKSNKTEFSYFTAFIPKK